jgi:probable phosphoglycerate mutase
MVRIVLIRPGSTDYDTQGRIQGQLDIPLADQGKREVAEATACLKEHNLTALYSSLCRAAQETAELIGAGLKLKPKTLERLQNLDHGLWQGMLIDEVKHKQPKVYKQWQEHPENVCPPEGEMLAAVAQRTEIVLAKLLRKHRFGTIGIVAPEPLASVIRCRLQGSRFGDLWKAVKGCGRIDVFETLGGSAFGPMATVPPAPAVATTAQNEAPVEKLPIAVKAK